MSQGNENRFARTYSASEKVEFSANLDGIKKSFKIIIRSLLSTFLRIEYHPHSISAELSFHLINQQSSSCQQTNDKLYFQTSGLIMNCKCESLIHVNLNSIDFIGLTSSLKRSILIKLFRARKCSSQPVEGSLLQCLPTILVDELNYNRGS